MKNTIGMRTVFADDFSINPADEKLVEAMSNRWPRNGDKKVVSYVEQNIRIWWSRLSKEDKEFFLRNELFHSRISFFYHFNLNAFRQQVFLAIMARDAKQKDNYLVNLLEQIRKENPVFSDDSLMPAEARLAMFQVIWKNSPRIQKYVKDYFNRAKTSAASHITILLKEIMQEYENGKSKKDHDEDEGNDE